MAGALLRLLVAIATVTSTIAAVDSQVAYKNGTSGDVLAFVNVFEQDAATAECTVLTQHGGAIVDNLLRQVVDAESVATSYGLQLIDVCQYFKNPDPSIISQAGVIGVLLPLDPFQAETVARESALVGKIALNYGEFHGLFTNRTLFGTIFQTAGNDATDARATAEYIKSVNKWDHAAVVFSDTIESESQARLFARVANESGVCLTGLYNFPSWWLNDDQPDGEFPANVKFYLKLNDVGDKAPLVMFTTSEMSKAIVEALEGDGFKIVITSDWMDSEVNKTKVQANIVTQKLEAPAFITDPLPSSFLPSDPDVLYASWGEEYITGLLSSHGCTGPEAVCPGLSTWSIPNIWSSRVAIKTLLQIARKARESLSQEVVASPSEMKEALDQLLEGEQLDVTSEGHGKGSYSVTKTSSGDPTVVFSWSPSEPEVAAVTCSECACVADDILDVLYMENATLNTVAINLPLYTTPLGKAPCSQFSVDNFLSMMAMIYATRQYNIRLPSQDLEAGYVVYDSCDRSDGVLSKYKEPVDALADSYVVDQLPYQPTFAMYFASLGTAEGNMFNRSGLPVISIFDSENSTMVAQIDEHLMHFAQQAAILARRLKWTSVSIAHAGLSAYHLHAITDHINRVADDKGVHICVTSNHDVLTPSDNNVEVNSSAIIFVGSAAAQDQFLTTLLNETSEEHNYNLISAHPIRKPEYRAQLKSHFLIPEGGSLSGFTQFVANSLNPQDVTEPTNPWKDEAWKAITGCSEMCAYNKGEIEDALLNLSPSAKDKVRRSVYAAIVYFTTVEELLKKRCNNKLEFCENALNVSHAEVFDIIANGRYRLIDGRELTFKDQMAVVNVDVMLSEAGAEYSKIGQCDSSECTITVEISRSLMRLNCAGEQCSPCIDQVPATTPELDAFRYINETWGIVILIIAVVGMCLAIIFAVVMCLFHKKPGVATASAGASVMTCLGAILMLGSVLIFLAEISVPICRMQRVVIPIALSWVLGALMVGAIRVLRLSSNSLVMLDFNSHWLHVVGVLCGILVQLLLSVGWLLIERPKVLCNVTPTPDGWVEACECDYSEEKHSISLVYVLILAVATLALSLFVRRPSHVGYENLLTAAAVFLMMLVSAVWQLVVLKLDPEGDDYAQIHSIYLVVIAYIVLLVVITPRFLSTKKPKHTAKRKFGAYTSRSFYMGEDSEEDRMQEFSNSTGRKSERF